MPTKRLIRSTTVLSVRRDGNVVLAGDGQVTLGESVIKHTAKKIRRLYNDKILSGFAGSTADAFTLFSRFESKLEQYHGNLGRAAVELAKDWRTDKFLRHLEALLLVCDKEQTFLLSGQGDVIEPDGGVAAIGIYAALIIMPMTSSGPLRDFALKRNNDLREKVGWNELVARVAAIRDALPAEQQADLGIVVGNYGEQGAIALLGKTYGLPPPITMVNSGWLRGYPQTPPRTVIVLGSSRERADELFVDCRLAGHSGNAWGVVNEESRDHPDIFVCGRARKPWSALWSHGPEFG